MNQQHRPVPCPATAVATQFAAISVIGGMIVANAHANGSAAMRETRERRANLLSPSTFTACKR